MLVKDISTVSLILGTCYYSHGICRFPSAHKTQEISIGDI